MDISRNMIILSTLFKSENKESITIKGLDCFVKEFNKKSMIHIYGRESSGKTALAMDLMYKNPDKSFIYIDTYYSVDNVPDNCILFRTNEEKQIVSFLEKLEPNICDCIIIDSYSNILGKREAWDAQTYEVMQEALKHIHNLTVNKNCTLILFNTENTNGKAFNRTNFIRINSVCELHLLNYYYDKKIIEVIPIKSRINTVATFIELNKEE